MRSHLHRPLGIAVPVRLAIALTLSLGTLLLAAPSGKTTAPPDKSGEPKAEAKKTKSASSKVGLSINDPRAYQGYTLVAPLMDTKVYLIDMKGKVVRLWATECTPGASTYFLENGHLLRAGSLMGEEKKFGGGPGAGGRVQEFAWDGNLIWDYKFFNDKQLQHHDITRMPNGNVLMIVWDKKSPKDVRAAGRRPELLPDSHFLPDSIIEVKPTGKTTGEIVWEWHLWDHMVQDFDKTKANYGNVAEHPELVNVNQGEDVLAPSKTTKDQQKKLQSIGYVGAKTASGKRPRVSPDWTHCNGISYNPELDQIVLSVHSFSEFWVIDHGTTSKEAAGHSGGRHGKGGDLLYRFGNPQVYRSGDKKDRKLFGQHNAHWIPPGLPGAGHLLVFNNGNGRSDGNYSSVDELALPIDAQGKYARNAKGAFEPAKLVWRYTAPKKSDFYSFFISGAQRLPNGNTLICSGANGTVFEVAPDNEIVWKYVNPVKGKDPRGGGAGKQPPLIDLVAPFVQDQLKMNDEQKKQLGGLQKDLIAELGKTLTDEQKKKLRQPLPGGQPNFPQPGQIISAAKQASLKLSGEQKKQLRDLQKQADDKLNKIFTADQKKQFKEMRANVGRGLPGGGPPNIGNALFRAYRYAPSYPGLAGKELTPGSSIEEMLAKEKETKKAATR